MELPTFKNVSTDEEILIEFSIKAKGVNDEHEILTTVFDLNLHNHSGFTELSLGKKYKLRINNEFTIQQTKTETVFIVNNHRLVYIKRQIKPIFEELIKINPMFTWASLGEFINEVISKTIEEEDTTIYYI